MMKTMREMMMMKNLGEDDLTETTCPPSYEWVLELWQLGQ